MCRRTESPDLRANVSQLPRGRRAQNGGSSVRPLRRVATLRDRSRSPAWLVQDRPGQSASATVPAG
jgi:hypothetical protein